METVQFDRKMKKWNNFGIFLPIKLKFAMQVHFGLELEHLVTIQPFFANQPDQPKICLQRNYKIALTHPASIGRFITKIPLQTPIL